MTNEIISYFEACQREGGNLQKGMNYRRGKTYSVILMSLRANAPYRDITQEEGTVLIYEGHDLPRYDRTINPKSVDQPEKMPSGLLTENGKFHEAAQEYKKGLRPPEKVKVYEKIKSGIWSYNGLFKLIDSWKEDDGKRHVFKFQLELLDGDSPEDSHVKDTENHPRIIPTAVKLEVWKRDKGQCAVCGSTKDLHFDHIIPYAKGGSSTTVDNIQILCARHNIEKRDHIE